jgi:hypothetical protein
MGYQALFETGEGRQVATTTGWGAFIAWADTLDVDLAGRVVQLAEYGWHSELPLLEKELAAALETEPPEDEPTRDVARGLLALIKERPSDDSAIVITDGVGAQTDEEDEADKRLASDGGQL